MTKTIYTKTAFFLALAGVLFSGYLSAVKFFTGTCALNETCPYFLGYPTCWFGFGMFLVLFIAATLALVDKISIKLLALVHSFVAILGVLFAGYFTVPEIRFLISGTGTKYSLGLPTCAYGLVFYVIILITALKYLKANKSQYV